MPGKITAVDKTNYMEFLIDDDEFLKKHNESWNRIVDKSSIDIDKRTNSETVVTTEIKPYMNGIPK